MSVRRNRVFVTHRDCPESALQLLRERCEVIICPVYPNITQEDLLEHCRDVDGILWVAGQKMDEKIMDAAGPNLRVVVTMSVGYNQLDVAEARRRGIKLGYTPNVNSKAVAEIAMVLLLEVARRVHEGRKCIYNNTWPSFRPQWMMGKDVVGSTVGIVGFGSIGQAVARRLLGFEVALILYSGPSRKPEGDAVGAVYVSFEELLSRSDFVVVACPLNEDTHHLFDERAFKLMKSTAVFVNIARGGIVDQDALLNALQTGQIWGAGLDVTMPEPLPADHPILQLDNCVVSPHLGAMTERTQSTMAELAARNILAAFDGKEMPAEIPHHS